MCGIIGYIGTKEATPILLEGLRRMEYRGYDSAGIAIINGKGVHIAKLPGRRTSRTRKPSAEAASTSVASLAWT